MILKTNIRVDEPSKGTTYPREVLEKLTALEYRVPGAFNVDIERLGPDLAADWVTAKHQFTLVGFDLIDDWLYVRLDAEEQPIVERIETGDYVVKLLIAADYHQEDDIRVVTKIREIRGVALEAIQC